MKHPDATPNATPSSTSRAPLSIPMDPDPIKQLLDDKQSRIDALRTRLDALPPAHAGPIRRLLQEKQRHIDALRTRLDALRLAEHALAAALSPATHTARQRLEIIRPLLERPRPGRKNVEQRAHQAGYSTHTLYRWIALYRETGDPAALQPGKRGWRTHHSRLDPRVDTLIADAFTYRSGTGPLVPVSSLLPRIFKACDESGLPRPSATTVYARIKRLSQQGSPHETNDPPDP